MKMKNSIIFSLSIAIWILCMVSYGIGYVTVETRYKKIINALYIGEKNNRENFAKEMQKICNETLEKEDREWSDRYNIVLKRLNTVEANMDMLDIWTGDKITVNYKNGMTRHFIVEEHKIVEKP